MRETVVGQLAQFTATTEFSQLPTDVVYQCKRILLDTLGCALAATDEPKGEIGIEIAQQMGGSSGSTTVIGTHLRSSVFGSAFANGELMNALDYDLLLPPGHVTPYVLPVVLAIGEEQGSSGKDILTGIAISHEISNRFGKAMDYLRDTKDGIVTPPEVFGYSSSIFGATAAGLKLRGKDASIVANGLGIAANISPVNSHWAWVQHAPSTTIKYLMAGVLTQAALTAVYSAALGHRGDLQILDDREAGYAKFINSKRWAPEKIVEQIGTVWAFQNQLSYKFYPHCGVLHGPFDCMARILESQDIRPEEIDGIRVFVEGMVMQPMWLNNTIEHVQDAQFSIAHGIATGAQRIPPGKRWQSPEVVFSKSVMGLMEKVTYEVHPDYVKLLNDDPASRPARVEISARGQTFVAESRYPRGRKSPDPHTYMTDEQLVAKFQANALEVLDPTSVDRIVDTVMNLERVDDIRTVMAQLVPSAAHHRETRPNASKS